MAEKLLTRKLISLNQLKRELDSGEAEVSADKLTNASVAIHTRQGPVYIEKEELFRDILEMALAGVAGNDLPKHNADYDNELGLKIIQILNTLD